MRQGWVTVRGDRQRFAVPHNQFASETASRGQANLLAKDSPHR
jgi:hypothetical protein